METFIPFVSQPCQQYNIYPYREDHAETKDGLWKSGIPATFHPIIFRHSAKTPTRRGSTFFCAETAAVSACLIRCPMKFVDSARTHGSRRPETPQFQTTLTPMPHSSLQPHPRCARSPPLFSNLPETLEFKIPGDTLQLPVVSTVNQFEKKKNTRGFLVFFFKFNVLHRPSKSKSHQLPRL